MLMPRLIVHTCYGAAFGVAIAAPCMKCCVSLLRYTENAQQGRQSSIIFLSALHLCEQRKYKHIVALQTAHALVHFFQSSCILRKIKLVLFHSNVKIECLFECTNNLCSFSEQYLAAHTALYRGKSQSSNAVCQFKWAGLCQINSSLK